MERIFNNTWPKSASEVSPERCENLNKQYQILTAQSACPRRGFLLSFTGGRPHRSVRLRGLDLFMTHRHMSEAASAKLNKHERIG